MRLFGVSFGESNTKLGNVFTFSLPSRITCPGASSWCRKHCYAKRYERLRPTCRKAYRDNYDLAKITERFVRIMTGVLPRILPCMRIHTSGDFFSADYINAWKEICSEFPQVRFWTYTRSWSVPDLLPSLEELRSLDNVSLFASTDPTMKLPPKDWRTAFIACDPRAEGIACRTQNSEESSCLDCGYCFGDTGGNVVFKVH